MEVKVYSILDCLAHEWGNPFLAVNDAVANRIMLQSLPKGYNSDEFELYDIGTFDTKKGLVESKKSPVLLYVKQPMPGQKNESIFKGTNQ